MDHHLSGGRPPRHQRTVMELDPVMQIALTLTTVFCVYRLALAIYTYVDAQGRGSDAMSWMALVSVLGLLGFAIWLVMRPKNDTPYSPPGYFGPFPGIYYPPPAYQGTSPQVSPTENPPGVAPPSPPQGPIAYPMPVQYPAPMPYRSPVQYPAPQPYPAQYQYPSPQPYPAPFPQPAPSPYYPPGYFPPAAQPPPAAKPAFNPFAVRRMVATFFAAMAFTLFIELPVMFFVFAQTSPDIDNTQAAMASMITPEMILFSVAVQDAILVYFLYIAMLKPGHITLKGMGLSFDSRVANAVLIGSVVGLGIFGLSTMVGVLVDGTGLFGTPESPFQASGALGFALIAISTVLIAPFAEELFFRGYALTVLERKWGAAAGVMLSAVIFALAHGSAYQFIVIIPAGLVLGLSYRKWGIMPCMTAHAVNNLIAVLLMFLA
jgi:membrane protease YdiL (CAAX protease family)